MIFGIWRYSQNWIAKRFTMRSRRRLSLTDPIISANYSVPLAVLFFSYSWQFLGRNELASVFSLACDPTRPELGGANQNPTLPVSVRGERREYGRCFNRVVDDEESEIPVALIGGARRRRGNKVSTVTTEE